MRVPRKRGPKGPRVSTSNRVAQYQEQIRQDQASDPGPESPDTGLGRSPQSPASNCADEQIRQRRPPSHSSMDDGALDDGALDPLLNGFDPGCPQLPLWLYIEYLEKFRDSLTPVWPIVDIDSLVERLKKQSPDDYEAFALAGAVCATVIAQLRLSQLRLPKQQRSTSDISVVAETFARHAQHLRDQHSYRESESTDSLLTAFFLHVYFANTERIRAGAMYLHEAIAQLSLQRLHQPETFDHLPEEQRELMLRIFWLVFVTERTFCVQNGFPTCLSPIKAWPSEGYQVFGLGGLDPSFQLLSRLFTLLDDNLLMPGERLVPKSGPRTPDSLYQGLSTMAEGPVSVIGPTLPEIQRVNVTITWHWIRILWWQYALQHCRMSSSMDGTMLSMLGPASVAHQTVQLFASVSHQAIRTHGYGMELKIFRIADSLVDLLACNPRLLSSGSGMLLGARDTLHALEDALVLVGGKGSLFYKKLQLCMAEVRLPVTDVRALPCEREVTLEDEA
ncbi:AflYd/sugR/sugar regulator [Colletotrichum tabaci]|uniref:AflYd/sugR/sugar regulator n=1 Tax=Colletotrichum tabaci TaxID=1209068 RepID=A0AAV9T4U6_9PEZI